MILLYEKSKCTVFLFEPACINKNPFERWLHLFHAYIHYWIFFLHTLSPYLKYWWLVSYSWKFPLREQQIEENECCMALQYSTKFMRFVFVSNFLVKIKVNAKFHPIVLIFTRGRLKWLPSVVVQFKVKSVGYACRCI